MSALHLDTHVVAWLYAGEHARFPDALRDRLGVDRLRISPMVRLELTYLHEIGRITAPAARIIDELERAVGLAEDESSMGAVVKAAENLPWTRDPFDRLIAAQALVSFSILVTKDARVREALGQHALWE